MADDQQNPFTMMGMMNMMQPNKYEPLQFKNRPLSLQGFRGPATDARGNVIQSYADAQQQHDAWDQAHPAAPAGMTLNSAPGGTANRMDFSSLAPNMFPDNPQAQSNYAYALGLTTHAPQTGLGGATATAAQPAQSGGGANPVDMRQAYLDALANPGHVTTPGATIQPSQPVGSPSVLDSFLAQNKGGTGAGGYSNAGFFDALNKLRSA